MNRLARCALPYDDGFALVGDADGGDIARARTGFAENLDGTAHLAGQDFHGVVFDPPGLRIELFELVLGDGDDCACLVEEDCAGTGGALIECEDIRHCVSAFGHQSNTMGLGGARCAV